MGKFSNFLLRNFYYFFDETMQGFRFFAFKVVNRELKTKKSSPIANILPDNLVIYRMFCILGGVKCLKLIAV